MSRPTRTRRAPSHLRALLSGHRLWFRFWGAGIIICNISMAFLRPSYDDALAMACVGVLSAIAILVGALVFGTRSAFGQLYPVLVGFLALALCGTLTLGLAPALNGFFTVSFVYIGLTQRPGTTVKLLPLATMCWLVINRPIDAVILAKVPVALGVWLLIGELLSHVTAERAADKAALAKQASQDALTGLLNRHGLDERLAALDRGDAVVFLDLDYFKKVNDTFGHATGDRVLADLGRVVLAVLRPKDVGVRYGGEEVLLLLPSAAPGGVDKCIDRLRMGWAASHPELTFSAGVAIVDERGGPDAVLRADDALYEAKEAGRNRTIHAPGPVLAVSSPRETETTAV